MAKSRLDKRREIEAAEAAGKTTSAKAKKEAKSKKSDSTAKKKKATRKSTTTRTRKKKADLPPRRRLVWVLYSSTMREEGRFLYHERDKAEERLQALLSKGKRKYFIQPIKEPLDSDGNPLIPDDDELTKAARRDVDADEDSEETEGSGEMEAVEGIEADDIDLDVDDVEDEAEDVEDVAEDLGD
ncbi:MAG: hypothetical protein KDA81_12150 [Planctomycetaceae bacterium]|nr:hypothetical protein [Planctomycetaceae bacterium]